MDSIVWILVLGASVWVLIDAKTIGVKKGQIPGFFNMGAVGWFIACLLFWIVAFPAYLAKRPEYKKVNAGYTVASTVRTKGKSAASKILFLAVIGIAGLYIMGGADASNQRSEKNSHNYADTSHVPVEEPENYPNAKDGTKAYEECVIKSIKQGDASEVTLHKCVKKIGEMRCIDQGVYSDPVYDGALEGTLDTRCFKSLFNEYIRLFAKYANQEQRDEWKRVNGTDITSDANESPTILYDQDAPQAATISTATAEAVPTLSDDTKEAQDASPPSAPQHCYQNVPRGAPCFPSQAAYEAWAKERNDAQMEVFRKEREKKPSEAMEKSWNGLRRCLLHSIATGAPDTVTLQRCVKLGITWCNAAGTKTSPLSRVDPVSGQIIIDNPNCSYNLAAEYQSAYDAYVSEMNNYTSMGASAYAPIAFDIRKYKSKAIPYYQ